jgi:hypothetical protein
MSTDDGVAYCNRKISKLKATLDDSEKVGAAALGCLLQAVGVLEHCSLGMALKACRLSAGEGEGACDSVG